MRRHVDLRMRPEGMAVRQRFGGEALRACVEAQLRVQSGWSSSAQAAADLLTRRVLLEAEAQVLRQTLGDDPQRPEFVQTVHRRGYRFVARVRAALRRKTQEY